MKMKNFQVLENCFADDSENIRDVAKMEAIRSKLIRQNSRLQKEKDRLVLQARKQEVCISHLLKKLENAADLAKEQQTSFDEALHQQTETVASMLQELSNSRAQIIQLQNELDLERAKNASKGQHERKVHRIPGDDEDAEDFSDDVTVRRRNNNAVSRRKNVAKREDEMSASRHSIMSQETHYKDSLRNSLVGSHAPSPPPAATARLVRHSSAGDPAELRMHRDRFRPDDDIETISQPFAASPFDAAAAKRIPRSGLQEVDTSEAPPRPPLSSSSSRHHQSSGMRGSTHQSSVRLPAATKLNSRSFAMDAVRLSRSSRSLGAGY